MNHDILAIGASAGGVEAVKTVLSGLPEDLPASVFVTVHTAPTGLGYLPQVLAAECPLEVRLGQGKDEIRQGCVYIAAPNLHLLVRRGYIQSRFLPKENGVRPAIDPMFRSAAQSYGARVIGMVLTGMLDDGTAGLGIIRDMGGLTVVQDPGDAAYPEMPLSAIRNVKTDHVTSLENASSLIVDLVNTEVILEVSAKWAEPNRKSLVMTCPGCGGVLTHYANENTVWFQCRSGHRFTSESMMFDQNSMVEELFWRLLSVLGEKEDMARTMVSDSRATVTSMIDPKYFQSQADASVEAQKCLIAMIDRLGPLLFPGVELRNGPGK